MAKVSAGQYSDAFSVCMSTTGMFLTAIAIANDVQKSTKTTIIISISEKSSSLNRSMNVVISLQPSGYSTLKACSQKKFKISIFVVAFLFHFIETAKGKWIKKDTWIQNTKF